MSYYKLVKDNFKYFTNILKKNDIEDIKDREEELDFTLEGGKKEGKKMKYNLTDLDWDDLEEDDEDIYTSSVKKDYTNKEFDTVYDKVFSHKFTGDIEDTIKDELDNEAIVDLDIKEEDELESPIPNEIIEENQEESVYLNDDIIDADFDDDEDEDEESESESEDKEIKMKEKYNNYFNDIDDNIIDDINKDINKDILDDINEDINEDINKDINEDNVDDKHVVNRFTDDTELDLDEIDSYITSYFSGLEGGKHISNIKDELNKDYNEYSSSITLTGGNFKPIKTHKSNLYPYNLY